MTGFTLVELLVVIGIIALLIAILLPSLANARRSAQRVACSVKLQQIMVAATVHASDHKGFYPLAGVLGDVTPYGLNDGNTNHYDYFQYTPYNANNVLAPITFALAKEMSYKGVLDITDNTGMAKMETDSSGFIKNFMCPSQGSSIQEIGAQFVLYTGTIPNHSIWDYEAQSCIFNEFVVGYDDAFGRLRGKASSVRQAARTMFCADGTGGSLASARDTSQTTVNSGIPMETVYNNVRIDSTVAPTAPITLSDAFQGRYYRSVKLAGDPENFDLRRHRGKINVAFCDGHVETLDISNKGLQSVFISAP